MGNRLGLSYLLVAVNNKKFESRRCDWIASFNDLNNPNVGHVTAFYIFGDKRDDIKPNLEGELKKLEALKKPSKAQKALAYNLANLIYLLNNNGCEVELTGFVKAWGQKNNVSVNKETSILMTVPN